VLLRDIFYVRYLSAQDAYGMIDKALSPRKGSQERRAKRIKRYVVEWESDVMISATRTQIPPREGLHLRGAKQITIRVVEWGMRANVVSLRALFVGSRTVWEMAR
jgi:hypothetical protein